MRTVTTSHPTRPYVLQNPASLPQTREPDDFRYHLPAAHDATLLVAALEDLEAQRVALEWLLEADLLCVCLV